MPQPNKPWPVSFAVIPSPALEPGLPERAYASYARLAEAVGEHVLSGTLQIERRARVSTFNRTLRDEHRYVGVDVGSGQELAAGCVIRQNPDGTRTVEALVDLEREEHETDAVLRARVHEHLSRLCDWARHEPGRAAREAVRDIATLRNRTKARCEPPHVHVGDVYRFGPFTFTVTHFRTIGADGRPCAPVIVGVCVTPSEVRESLYGFNAFVWREAELVHMGLGPDVDGRFRDLATFAALCDALATIFNGWAQLHGLAVALAYIFSPEGQAAFRVMSRRRIDAIVAKDREPFGPARAYALRGVADRVDLFEWEILALHGALIAGSTARRGDCWKAFADSAWSPDEPRDWRGRVAALVECRSLLERALALRLS